MRLLQDADQLRDARLVLLDDDELVRVRTAVGPHCHRLRAANHLRAALAEALPAAAHFVAQAPGRRAVPALHRMNGDAVADALAVDGEIGHRLGERRVDGGDGVFAGQLDTERGAVRAEFSDRLERRDAGEFEGRGHVRDETTHVTLWRRRLETSHEVRDATWRTHHSRAAGFSLSSMEWRRGPGRGGAFVQAPLSPALSPLVPRMERGFTCRGACVKLRSEVSFDPKMLCLASGPRVETRSVFRAVCE